MEHERAHLFCKCFDLESLLFVLSTKVVAEKTIKLFYTKIVGNDGKLLTLFIFTKTLLFQISAKVKVAFLFS